MTLQEEAQKALSRGSRLESTQDSTSRITNLEHAVRELQQLVVRLAGEVDHLKERG